MEGFNGRNQPHTIQIQAKRVLITNNFFNFFLSLLENLNWEEWLGLSVISGEMLFQV